jgi:hypothetical protein
MEVRAYWGKVRDMDGWSGEGGAYCEGVPVRRVYDAYEGRETIRGDELVGEVWFLEEDEERGGRGKGG